MATSSGPRKNYRLLFVTVSYPLLIYPTIYNVISSICPRLDLVGVCLVHPSVTLTIRSCPLPSFLIRCYQIILFCAGIGSSCLLRWLMTLSCIRFDSSSTSSSAKSVLEARGISLVMDPSFLSLPPIITKYLSLFCGLVFQVLMYCVVLRPYPPCV